ncbi:GH25 family lysozyme [Lactobacillus sp. ESL0228]|uniref:GH25 family lysozyme n=1 Tax=Lactobacillus sp. ESL0228 TaxID=2069352 RepID=UPI000EFD361E|nr:GH25 family lysozyme [Lactobacillus sp. ESL0228]RMC49572.1 lysozyme [Lactobacillus sp. ESL0228]
MKRFHHKYTLPAILTLLVVALGLLWLGISNLRSQTTLPSDANSSVIGLELDQTFGYIDLHEVQDHGVSFVYLKSTQGRTYFDDDYLSYRDQILGTKLAFGTIIAYSNESTPIQHLRYFNKKVGSNTGTLPILIVPAVKSRNSHYLMQMAQFTQLLKQSGKKVMVKLSVRYHKYFASDVLFMADVPNEPSKLQYAFWCYNHDGHVQSVNGLEDGVTMFAYNGTVAQYKQKYGQLIQ